MLASAQSPPRHRAAVYETVKRAIIMNDFKPGESITELGLAHRLGCSQGMVRETLLRLQEDGLVVRSGYKGTVISELVPGEVRVIIDIRRKIETEATPVVVAKAVDADVARLETLLEEMTQAARAGDVYEVIRLDTAFHMTLFGIAQLRAVDQILTRCILHSHRFKLWAPEHRRPLIETARRHQPIVAALAARDAGALADALGLHLDTIVEPWPAAVPA